LPARWLLFALYTMGASLAITEAFAMATIRVLTPADHSQVLAIYGDAVSSQAPGVYSEGQVRAWLSQLGPGGPLAASLGQGTGLVSCAESGEIEAFALMQPPDRLSLLYCRGRSARQGHASRLLAAVETLSQRQGLNQLRTEASELSRPLLQRLGWRVVWQELLLIDAIPFRRYRMTKSLVALP
jgi:L-amino acid N-acyltransferase YncA